MTIVYRDEKGVPLTSEEVDGNFRDLDGRVSTAQTKADNAHTLASQAKTVADAAQVKLVAGSNITIDVTDPNAPVISASGGGGTGTVQTVAGVAPVEGDVPSAGLITALGIDSKLPVSQKAAPNGVASLDSSGKVPVAQLPSYVDDVLEFFTLAAMPRPGESGKIYIALNTNKQYRWPEAGSDYVELVASPGTTDAIPEGTVNKWWTNARTLASVLTGIVFTTGATITATDSVLSAFGKLQKQITDAFSSLNNKANSGVNADITQLTSIDATGYNVLRTGLPVMTGATSGAIGVKGLVPTPSAGDQLKFLRADGTWSAVSANTTWGGISGTLSDQADLKSALDAKVASTDKRLPTAWVNFNGTGTVAMRSQHNVSSVSDLGTGYYFINFATPMDNVNYVVTWANDTDQDGISDMTIAVGAPQRLIGMVESRKTVNGFPVYCGAQNNAARLDYRSVQLIIMGGKN